MFFFKTILEDFNLEIKEGEIHALMGKNGAGKSTISKVILDFYFYIGTFQTIPFDDEGDSIFQ